MTVAGAGRALLRRVGRRGAGRRDLGRSAKTELIAVVVVIVTVFAVASAVRISIELSDVEDETRQKATFAAGLAADAVVEELALARDTIDSTAANPALLEALSQPPGDCGIQFTMTSFPGSHLDLVSPDGVVICSSLAVAERHTATGPAAPWIGALGADEQATTSELYADPLTGRSAIAVVSRVLLPDGGPAGFVAAVLPVDGIATELARVFAGPDRLRFVITAADGALVSAVEGPPAAEATLSAPRDAVFGSADLSASASVEGVGWQVVAGMDRSAALAGIGTTLARGLVITVATLSLSVGLVFVVYRRLARPLARLATAMVDAHHGAVLVPVECGPAEVRQLAAEFAELMAVRDSSEEHLARRALTDHLTGLANRSALHRALVARLASGGAGHLMFLDLDRFKVVNDSLGHEAGDSVIVETAHRLGRLCGPADLVARLGGDEFAVLLGADVEFDEARRQAEAVLFSIALPFEITIGGAASRAFLGASIGLAALEGHAIPGDVLRAADLALYRAKENGRGQVACYDEQLRAAAMHRDHVELIIRSALDTGGFVPYLQPIVDVHGATVAHELLLRLDSERGPELPPDLIGIAEQSGLVVDLDTRMLMAAAALVADDVEGCLGTLHVNLSAATVLHPDFGNFIAAVRDVAHRRCDRLAIELTEGVLLQDGEAAASVVDALRLAGFRVGIDRFGCGYTALDHLRAFHLNFLKIDRSFTAEVGVDAGARAFVAAFVRIANAFGLDVVAQGVENDDQAVRLRALGCGLVQGYHYGRPSPIQRWFPGVPATRLGPPLGASVMASRGQRRSVRPTLVLDPDSCPVKQNHRTELYAEGSTIARIVRYAVDGLRAGDEVLLVTSDFHRIAVEAELASAPGLHDRRCRFLDAHATLAQCVVDGVPDLDLFRSTVGTVIAGLLADGVPLRVYAGTMNQKSRDGQVVSALAEVWNDIRGDFTFDLLCGEWGPALDIQPAGVERAESHAT